jgi:hypothetical protein
MTEDGKQKTERYDPLRRCLKSPIIRQTGCASSSRCQFFQRLVVRQIAQSTLSLEDLSFTPSHTALAQNHDLQTDIFHRKAAYWQPSPRLEPGGARRDRTDDLMLAKHALSQLSYGPGENGRPASPNLVGLGGLEPPTSRLSSARSNQLSYKPEAVRKRDEDGGSRKCGS